VLLLATVGLSSDDEDGEHMMIFGRYGVCTCRYSSQWTPFDLVENDFEPSSDR
jgi:hypothetical protein